MSPTLAAGDRTIIPVYEGIHVYWPSRYEHTTINIMKMNTWTWS